MKITAQEEYGLRCLLRLARAGDGRSLTIPGDRRRRRAVGPLRGQVAGRAAAGGADRQRPRPGRRYRLASRCRADQPRRGDAGPGRAAVRRAELTANKHAGTETTDGRCVHIGGCTLRALWQTLEEWMRRRLDQITLADLLQSEGRLTELLRARLAEAVLRRRRCPAARDLADDHRPQ